MVAFDHLRSTRTAARTRLTRGSTSANEVFTFSCAVNDLIDPVGNFFAGAVHYGSVQTENEKLQATIGHLRAEQAEKGFENRQLRPARGAGESALSRRRCTR